MQIAHITHILNVDMSLSFLAQFSDVLVSQKCLFSLKNNLTQLQPIPLHICHLQKVFLHFPPCFFHHNYHYDTHCLWYFVLITSFFQLLFFHITQYLFSITHPSLHLSSPKSLPPLPTLFSPPLPYQLYCDNYHYNTHHLCYFVLITCLFFYATKCLFSTILFSPAHLSLHPSPKSLPPLPTLFPPHYCTNFTVTIIITTPTIYATLY